MTECVRVIDRIFRALENSLDCGRHSCQKLSSVCGSWLAMLSASLRVQHSKFLFFRVMWCFFEIFFGGYVTQNDCTPLYGSLFIFYHPIKEKRIDDSQNNYHGLKSTPHNC